MRHLAHLVLKRKRNRLIYLFANTFLPQVCSRHCFLVCFFPDTGFMSYEHWEHSAFLRGTSSCPHALKTEQVCLCVSLWFAMQSAVMSWGDVPENAELLVSPAFLGSPLMFPMLVVCVCLCECKNKNYMRQKHLKLWAVVVLEKKVSPLCTWLLSSFFPSDWHSVDHSLYMSDLKVF